VDIDLEAHERYIMDMVGDPPRCRGCHWPTADQTQFPAVRLMRHAMSLGYASLYRFAPVSPTRDPETGFKFFGEKRCGASANTTAAGWFWDSEAMAYSTLLAFASTRCCASSCDADKRSSVQTRRRHHHRRASFGFALLKAAGGVPRRHLIVVAQAFPSPLTATEYGDGPVGRFGNTRSPVVARET
jgi:hypothetical protein